MNNVTIKSLEGNNLRFVLATIDSNKKLCYENFTVSIIDKKLSSILCNIDKAIITAGFPTILNSDYIIVHKEDLCQNSKRS